MRWSVHAQVGHPGRRRSDRDCSRTSGEVEDFGRQHPVRKEEKRSVCESSSNASAIRKDVPADRRPRVGEVDIVDVHKCNRNASSDGVRRPIVRVSRDEGSNDDEREAAADGTSEEKHTASDTVKEEDSRKSEDLRGSPNMGVSPVLWKSTRIPTVPRLLSCPAFRSAQRML